VVDPYSSDPCTWVYRIVSFENAQSTAHFPQSVAITLHRKPGLGLLCIYFNFPFETKETRGFTKISIIFLFLYIVHTRTDLE
jgi:hypothetical protein